MNKAKTLLYFGYGSNMSTQYLIKRRKTIPLESQPGLLKDYELIMNMGGPNFLEPSFANIRPYKGSIVEGVVHEIDENMGTIQTNPAYDFYHMLVNEGTFRKLFKRSAQNYINQSKEYVVQ